MLARGGPRLLARCLTAAGIGGGAEALAAAALGGASASASAGPTAAAAPSLSAAAGWARRLHSSAGERSAAAATGGSGDASADTASSSAPAAVGALSAADAARAASGRRPTAAEFYPAGPGHTCRVRLTVKGFELRYVQAASAVLQDLLLLSVSPLRAEGDASDPALDEQRLYFPLGDAGVPQRIPRYTVLRRARAPAAAAAAPR